MTAAAERIVCKTSGCGQIIAVRWRNGSVKPVITDSYVDEKGRIVIICPKCGQRNRNPK